MKEKSLICFFAILLSLGICSVSEAVVIDFAGGTATLSDNSTVTTTNTGLWDGIVKSYEEDGMLIEFIGGYGTIGDYYSTGQGTGGGAPYENSVIHAHPFTDITIRFSKLDGSLFDLNYVDMTSNTIIGGDLSNGTERSFITANTGAEMLLPSSHWGFDYTWYGKEGDGVARLMLNDLFNDISSFELTSENAYCFGMDNFYIDEPPPSVPEPATMLLLGVGLAGLAAYRRKFRQ